MRLYRIHEFIATVAYFGYAPVGPGTVGSIPPLFIYFFLPALSLPVHGAILMGMFTIGTLSAEVIRLHKGGQDPSCIVIDEVVGMSLVLCVIPKTLLMYGISFILFRFFDIVKPFPISYCERHIPGGLGSMVDDLLAGLMTIGVLKLALHYIF